MKDQQKVRVQWIGKAFSSVDLRVPHFETCIWHIGTQDLMMDDFRLPQSFEQMFFFMPSMCSGAAVWSEAGTQRRWCQRKWFRGKEFG